MNPQTVRLHLTFRGPFAVGTGSPQDGVDEPIDLDEPLPASALKGLLRGRARDLLGVHNDVVERIFGSPQQDATWTWRRPVFETVPQESAWTRLAIADGAGNAARGMLVSGSHVWATTATCTVAPTSSADPDDAVILRAAARAVSSLGGGRRRGEGWVTIVDVGPDNTVVPWTDADTAALREALR